MASILLGNIKGPKGDTGPQGIQGEIGPVGPQGPLPPLVNNALATEAGVAALDSAMGPTFQNQIDTLNSNLSVIGTTYSVNPPSYVSCDSGISAEITGITLPAGTYIISAGLSWSDTVRGGGRRIHIRQGDYYNSPVIADDATDDFLNDAAPMEQSATGIVVLSTGSNIKLWATQTSGSNLSVESTAFLKAVRIK